MNDRVKPAPAVKAECFSTHPSSICILENLVHSIRLAVSILATLRIKSSCSPERTYHRVRLSTNPHFHIVPRHHKASPPLLPMNERPHFRRVGATGALAMLSTSRVVVVKVLVAGVCVQCRLLRPRPRVSFLSVLYCKRRDVCHVGLSDRSPDT